MRKSKGLDMSQHHCPPFQATRKQMDSAPNCNDKNLQQWWPVSGLLCWAVNQSVNLSVKSRARSQLWLIGLCMRLSSLKVHVQMPGLCQQTLPVSVLLEKEPKVMLMISKAKQQNRLMSNEECYL